MVLRNLERKQFTEKEKAKLVDSLRQRDHEYLAFFVCRNPVEKLQSVYRYLSDLRVRSSSFVDHKF